MNYLFSLIAFVSFIISYSQDFIPMLEEENLWGTHYSIFPSTSIYEQLNVSDEININGFNYKYVYINGEESLCYLREQNGVLYAYNSYSDDEFVLLDFTLEVGDTFTIESLACFRSAYHELTVDNIYYTDIAGEYRKVLVLSGGWSGELWIEGVGSTSGGLYPSSYFIEGGTQLICFYHNGELYYFNGSTNCNLSIDDKITHKMLLYPNPVTDRSILQFSNDTIIDQIRIFDLTGKLIKEESISKDYFKIDAMQYPSGLYFYQVLSEGILIASDQFIVK